MTIEERQWSISLSVLQKGMRSVDMHISNVDNTFLNLFYFQKCNSTVTIMNTKHLNALNKADQFSHEGGIYNTVYPIFIIDINYVQCI